MYRFQTGTAGQDLHVIYRDKKAGKAAPAEKAEEGSFLEDYAGIEAAVTDTEGRLLFTAKLLGLEENHGDLHQLSDASISREMEAPLTVQLRGYSSRKSKAACTKHTIREEKLYQAVLATVQAQIQLAVSMDELLRELCAESHSLVLKKLPQYVRKEILKESD